MKVAVIGNGKTGAQVQNLLAQDEIVGPFNSKNPVTISKLQEADFGIVFVPPLVFKSIKPILIDSKIPMIVATTGVEFDEDLNKNLKSKNTVWVHGANFSLGMQIARKLLEQTRSLLSAFPQFKTQIHEVHHTQKVDAPSGTAKMWNTLIGGETKITFERKDDVKGFHQLTLSSGLETIEIRHDAHDRKIFAEGTIWCAHFLNNNKLEAGLYNFNTIIERYITNQEASNDGLAFNNYSLDSNHNSNERQWTDQLSKL